MAKAFVMKQKPTKSICSIISQSSSKILFISIFKVKPCLVFSHSLFYVAMNSCGKILKSVEVLEKNVGTFYVIRHVMAAFYDLAGMLRIRVPSN